jgi:hypothetical protein
MHIVERIWRKQPGEFFFFSTKTTSGAWKDRAFRRDEIDGVTEAMIQEYGRRWDLYFCVTGFDRGCRRKQNALGGHFLFADLDAVNPRRIARRPTVAFRTSPGRYQAL